MINNKIKNKMSPAIPIVLGEFDSRKNAAKIKSVVATGLLVTMVGLMVVICAVSYFQIIQPIADVLHREEKVAEQIEIMKSHAPKVTLTQLLQEHGIAVTHKASFGESQAVITIAGNTDISLLLYITSQIPGVFSLQYSQDGYQIFISGGSV